MRKGETATTGTDATLAVGRPGLDSDGANALVDVGDSRHAFQSVKTQDRADEVHILFNYDKVLFLSHVYAYHIFVTSMVSRPI